MLLPWAMFAGVDVFASTSLAVEQVWGTRGCHEALSESQVKSSQAKLLLPPYNGQLYNLHHDPLTMTNLAESCPRERGCMRMRAWRLEATCARGCSCTQRL